jgi:S2P endopeptidase
MKLFAFTRKNLNKALFLGLPTEVEGHLSVSEYIPIAYFSADVPNCIYKFSNFLIMFSGALAVVNLIPCFHFDGRLIAKNLLSLYFGKDYDLNKESYLRVWVDPVSYTWISEAMTFLGTCILVVYTILAFITAFTN